MIKVSVIMLAYNSEKYIATAIRGVVKQKTNYRIQLVLSDDVSTDGTYEICRRYKEQYPDIITLRRNSRNIGLQANFMEAYKCCEGEYIAMCDGDDYWCDMHKLQMMTDYMDSHKDCAVAFHRVINYYEDKGTKSLSNGGQKADITILDLARSNTITNCSCMYRRANCPVLPQWISQIKLCDYAMHILNASHGYIHYFNRPMAVYRQHASAIWSLKNLEDREKKLNMALHVRELIMDNLSESQPEACRIIRDAHTRFAMNEIRFSLDHGLNDAAERLKARVLKYRPEWTDADINGQLEKLRHQPSESLRTHIMAVLKKIRAAVSYFIPLPRV